MEKFKQNQLNPKSQSTGNELQNHIPTTPIPGPQEAKILMSQIAQVQKFLKQQQQVQPQSQIKHFAHSPATATSTSGTSSPNMKTWTRKPCGPKTTATPTTNPIRPVSSTQYLNPIAGALHRQRFVYEKNKSLQLTRNTARPTLLNNNIAGARQLQHPQSQTQKPKQIFQQAQKNMFKISNTKAQIAFRGPLKPYTYGNLTLNRSKPVNKRIHSNTKTETTGTVLPTAKRQSIQPPLLPKKTLKTNHLRNATATRASNHYSNKKFFASSSWPFSSTHSINSRFLLMRARHLVRKARGIKTPLPIKRKKSLQETTTIGTTQCKFYSKGKCTRPNCKFLHSLPKKHQNESRILRLGLKLSESNASCKTQPDESNSNPKGTEVTNKMTRYYEAALEGSVSVPYPRGRSRAAGEVPNEKVRVTSSSCCSGSSSDSGSTEAESEEEENKEDQIVHVTDSEPQSPIASSSGPNDKLVSVPNKPHLPSLSVRRERLLTRMAQLKERCKATTNISNKPNSMPTYLPFNN